MRENGLVVAIDGVVASGKGTLARMLAEKLGYIHIDTGAMYRAITFYLLEKEIDIENSDLVITMLPEISLEFKYNNNSGQNEIWLNGKNLEKDIRTERISKHVPVVAHIKEAREFTRHMQHGYADQGGIVLDGRDIGTIVFPDADLKIFLDADAEVRAKRRFDEMVQKGNPANLDQILEDLNSRDEYDRNAEYGKLTQADDAILIDSTHMTIPEVVDEAYRLAKEKLEK
jgi:cytidylate kinase